jgi:hypothetical protein
MAAQPTIVQAYQRGYVSAYLIGNYNSEGQLFGPRLSAPGSFVTITMFSDALFWGVDGGAQSAQLLRQMANYLTWLCGQFASQAQYILQGTGGGTVIPGTGSALPNPLDFVVDGSSPIPTSGTSITIPAYIGYNVQFARGGLIQYTTAPPDGVSTYYSWNRTTGVLILLNGAAQPTEQFRIEPIG